MVRDQVTFSVQGWKESAAIMHSVKEHYGSITIYGQEGGRLNAVVHLVRSSHPYDDRDVENHAHFTNEMKRLNATIKLPISRFKQFRTMLVRNRLCLNRIEVCVDLSPSQNLSDKGDHSEYRVSGIDFHAEHGTCSSFEHEIQDLELQELSQLLEIRSLLKIVTFVLWAILALTAINLLT